MGNKSSKETYTDIREIGNGTFSKVTLVEDAKKQKFAKKTIAYGAFTNSDRKMVLGEMELLRGLSHSNITEIFDFWDSPGAIYGGIGTIIMKYYSSGSARTLFASSNVEILTIDKNKTELCMKFLREMLSALEYIHARKIIHRDVKLENILVEKNADSSHLYTFYLADFGISHTESGSSDGIAKLAALKNMNLSDAATVKVKGICGTPLYMAPEIYNAVYGRSVDIYALGLALLEMRCGCPIHKLQDFDLASFQSGKCALKRSIQSEDVFLNAVAFVAFLIWMKSKSSLFCRLLSGLFLLFLLKVSNVEGGNGSIIMHILNSKMISADPKARLSCGESLGVLKLFQDRKNEQYDTHILGLTFVYLFYGDYLWMWLLWSAVFIYSAFPFYKLLKASLSAVDE